MIARRRWGSRSIGRAAVRFEPNPDTGSSAPPAAELTAAPRDSGSAAAPAAGLAPDQPAAQSYTERLLAAKRRAQGRDPNRSSE